MTSRDSAVERALLANAPDLLKYLQRRAGDEAPDLLGETMLVAWRRASDLPADEGEARMWLFGIARMTVMGHGRDASRRLKLGERLRGHLAPAVWPDDDLALEVRRAIDTLPADQAELVRLVHWEGFSIADAAQVMGLNASTARGRFQRAREALGRALAVAADRA